jgi:Mg-chelatase subunit ChlD
MTGKKIGIILIAALLLAGVFLILGEANGQGLESKSGGLAVALIIDSSGSMKNNDPAGVRIEAARKAVELLGEDDQVCVVEFADQAVVLVPLRKVGDQASRRGILEALSGIGAKGDTDIKGGLEKAYLELTKAEKEKKKFALMLTDGEPDLPYLLKNADNMAGYVAAVDNVAGSYKAQGWAVHCVALHREKAGELLQKIALATGGEYFFVQEAAELTRFFQSIMLVQKHSPAESPRLSYVLEARNYKVGEKFPVRAGLKIDQDYLIPGPHLKLEKFELAVTYARQEPQVIALQDDGEKESSADEQAGDGIFSAWVDCRQKGSAVVTLAAQGTYRDQKFNEQLELGKIKIRPEVALKERLLQGWQALRGQVLRNWWVIAAGLVVVLLAFLAAFFARFKKERFAAHLKGALFYRVAKEGGNNPAVQELNLEKVGRNEVLIATESDLAADFILPVQDRPFAFKVKKFSKAYTDVEDSKEFKLSGKEIYYMVICLPGTYLIYENIPKSRQQVFHGDRFKIGEYLFELNCPEARMEAKAGEEKIKKDTLRILKRLAKKK